MAILILVALFAGACTEKPAGTESPRLLGVEPLSASSVIEYQEVLPFLMRIGRNMTIVHVGPKDGLALVPDARMKKVRSMLKENAAGAVEGDLVNAHNYLFLASRFGLVRRIFWIIPYNHLDFINAEDRIRSFLRNEASHFRSREIDSMKFHNGCVSGTLAGIDVNICSPASMPPLEESAPVVIDTGFFPLAAERSGPTSLDAMREFVEIMASKGIRAKAALVIQSPELQAMCGFLSEETVSILKDPSIIKKERPPDLWSIRELAYMMLRLGDFKSAAQYLDRNIGEFPDDPFIGLMRFTAHSLVSKKRSELGALAALCTKRPVFCRGIADAGVLLRAQGDMAGAEEFLGRAVSLQPSLARARFEYALTLYEAGKYAEAHREASALSSMPGYEVSGGLLSGDGAFALQQNEEAISRYEKALGAYQGAGKYRLSAREQESVGRLRSLYELRNDKPGLKALEGISALE